MIRVALALGLLAGVAAPALADQVTPVAKWLQEGYEVKAAFSDNSGGAYIILEKGTSAYMCHSNPSQVCEKLN
jgi:hypothetical protein